MRHSSGTDPESRRSRRLKLLPQAIDWPGTKEEIEKIAADLEEWLDSVDPDETPAQDTSDLAAVAAATDVVTRAQAELRRAVLMARVKHERNWAEIGLALGVSR